MHFKLSLDELVILRIVYPRAVCQDDIWIGREMGGLVFYMMEGGS